MARPKRICLPNLTYHVSSRCIELRNMLAHDYFKELLIDVMKLALDKYDFEIISYQIMDNHFHFIIRTVDDLATISKIMQYIKSRFAVKYNKLMKRKGPFWNERFKDEIINYCEDPTLYLNRLLWKLAYDPVRKKKVLDPREYRYGCINVYLDENYKPPIKITYHEYFLNLGNTFLERVKKFLYYKKAELV
jgi:putative transposase